MDLRRYAAFSDDPAGGNPAGVAFLPSFPTAAEMQRIATEVGYSETAFLVAEPTPGTYRVRYFSPAAEVPFCGHATIASAVALADREGPGSLLFETASGPVPVETVAVSSGHAATLTSAPPRVEPAPVALVEAALRALRWSVAELDPALPPALAYAGVRHLVLAAATSDRLACLDYDFLDLRATMQAHELTTVDLVWREGPLRFRARNPFPVGGVVEDPATGAAAAAFGAYLRERGAVAPDATITLRQGVEMGRPSLLTVTLVPGDARVRVTGAAVPIPA